MSSNSKEYNEKYYTKKAIEYLIEKGVDINEHSIKRAKSYLSGKSNSKNYKKSRAEYMDSSFMRFVNTCEREGYYYADI